MGIENEDRGDNWTPTDEATTLAEKLPEKKEETAAPDAEAAAKLVKEIEDKKVADAKAAEDDKVDDDKDEKDADGKPKRKENRLPLSRVNEMIAKEQAKREAVENELAKYKQGAKVADLGVELTAAEAKLVELEKAYTKQLTDGEHDKAAATMADIRKTERSINTKTSQVREEAAEARAVERVRYDTTVERLEETFPQFNPDHTDFDKEKVGEIKELKEAYQLKGYTPTAALQKAVKLIMPPASKKQETALETTPRVDAAAVEAARKAAAVAKTAEAIDKTPANAAKTGVDSDKKGGGAVTAQDIMKMPWADFKKVDEATLAAARGDVL